MTAVLLSLALEPSLMICRTELLVHSAWDRPAFIRPLSSLVFFFGYNAKEPELQCCADGEALSEDKWER